tara:strand:- start:18697 stop:19683 length:987 start_codon:yes stop_codon:yes gene_type:complete
MEASHPNLHCLLYHPESDELLSGGEELVETWKKQPSAQLWLHIEGKLDQELHGLLESTFGLHPLALQDASRDRHPPKIEAFDDHSFIIFKSLTRGTKNLDFATLQFAMFVGERFLVTRTSGDCPSVAKLRTETEKNIRGFADGPELLAVRLMRLIVERYLNVLLAFEPELEAVEENLLERSDDQLLAEMTSNKASLKKMRRIFLYHEQILEQLRQTHPGFTSDREHEINDVYEQQERANSLTLLYYELASDLIDGYLSLSSHRLNQIMKVLTIITAIFVPLSFLAGIYGMNFENMPELNSKSGYFILLGVMTTIAAGLLFAFRKQKWI